MRGQTHTVPTFFIFWLIRQIKTFVFFLKTFLYVTDHQQGLWISLYVIGSGDRLGNEFFGSVFKNSLLGITYPNMCKV